MNKVSPSISTRLKAQITCVLIITSSFAIWSPAPAHAQATAAACAVGGALAGQISGALSGLAGNAAASTVSVPVNVVGSVQQNEAARNVKEFSLDRLASCAAKELLHQMTIATINWINGGFNGSPAYLTNPEAFFTNAADQVTGAFLADSGPLKNLCSPWSVDIRLALALGQSQIGNQNQYSCTLGTIIKNAKNTSFSVSGFVQGNFSQGGWPAFMSMVSEPQNNPYGAYLIANSNLLAAIGAKQSGLSKALLEGQGFLSWQNCQTVNASGFQMNGPTEKQCTTETPGSVIAHTLNVHTDSGVVEAELANDINSVVNALVTQLATQMLSKGLGSLSSSGSGVSGGGYSSSQSYLSQLQNDAAAGEISNSYASAVSLVTSSETNYENARSCFANKLALANASSVAATSVNGQTGGTGTSTNSLSGGETSTIQAYINSIDAVVNGTVQPLINTLTAKETSIQNGSTAYTSTVAQTDLINAQNQSVSFNAEATGYQNACNALQ